MHLTSKRNAADFPSRSIAARQAFRHRATNGAPPIVRILLSPTRVRRCKGRMRSRSRTHDTPIAIQQHSPCAAGPNINPQKLHRHRTLIIPNASCRETPSIAYGTLAATLTASEPAQLRNPQLPCRSPQPHYQLSAPPPESAPPLLSIFSRPYIHAPPPPSSRRTLCKRQGRKSDS